MAVFRYAGWVGTDRRWTDEAVLRESERWVHIPQDGMCSEDDRRLLVHLPKRWGTSRVWRSWAADGGQASYLIEETIGEVRAFGLGMLALHTGDRVAPPFMNECLARYRFQTTEKLEVLAYSLVDGREHRLPGCAFQRAWSPSSCVTQKGCGRHSVWTPRSSVRLRRPMRSLPSTPERWRS